MEKYMIGYNNENFITKEEAATLTIGDLVHAAKRFPETIFSPCEKEGNRIITTTPLTIRFWGLENRDIGYELELFSVRKYDDGIPEVETLHDAFQEIASKNGLGGQFAIDHDMPAFYRSTISGYLTGFKNGNLIENVILPLEKMTDELFNETYDRAIEMNMDKLIDLERMRRERREEAN